MNLSSSFKTACITLFFALQCILIPACGTDETPAPIKKKTVKKVSNKKLKSVKKAARKTEKSADAKKDGTKEYFYDAFGKPDPFVPLITEIEPPKKPDASLSKSKTPLTPLQKYALDELNLVAIIKSGDKYAALFEDLSEFGFIVKEDTLIGKNGGIVRKITYNKVIVEETAYGSSGELEKNIISLIIQHQE